MMQPKCITPLSSYALLCVTYEQSYGKPNVSMTLCGEITILANLKKLSTEPLGEIFF